LWVKDSQNYDFDFYSWGSNGTADFYVIDGILDWTFHWSGTSLDWTRSTLHRQYSFNLHVIDEDGVDVISARVQAWDKDDTLVFDVYTAADGTITEQIIEHGIYQPTEKVTLDATGYVDCVETDIGKMVQEDGADTGILLSYDNTNRFWFVNYYGVISATHSMTITGGTGAGTVSVNSAQTDFLQEKSPYRIKVSKEADGYNHIDYIGDIDEPIDWTLALTHPSSWHPR
jgi:hypothetical protein